MGKFLLSTLLLLTTVFASTAETWTSTATSAADWDNILTDSSKDTTKAPTAWKETSNNQEASWTMAYTWQTDGKIYYSRGKNGLTFGSSSAGVKAMTLSTTNIPGKITSVKIMGVKSNGSAKLSVTVGMAAYTYSNSESYTTTSTAKDVTFSGSNSGNITIDFTGNADGKYICLSGLEITYDSTPSNKCATPVAMINGEAITNGGNAVVGDELSFSCNTDDATITYTINGGNFTGESQTYDGNPIKLDKIGVYTITAKATKDGLTDSDELKIDDIDVVGKTPLMSFANSSVFGKVGTGVVWQKVIITEPNEENAGAITYSSSDPEIVTIDGETGQIKPEDVKKAGEVRIIATMAQNGDYAEGSAEYLIVVVDPNVPIQPSYTVFDFTAENPYGMTTQTGGSSYEKKIKAISGNNKTVTLSFEGNYRSYNNDTNPYHLRLHKDSKLIIKVPEGYKITKIGITGSSITGTYDPASGSVSDKTDPDGGTFSYVWIPQNESDVIKSITYTSSSNTLIKKINVMWDAADSELKPVQLTFTPNVNGIYVNEEAEINVVNNPNGRVITYSIPALDPEPGTETSESENQQKKYSIEEIDGKLKVRVTEPGSYTLEARSVGGDGFRDGFAIMRLNVYRHLAVYANEVALEEDVIDTGSGETEVTIDVPENANLYYRFENSTTPETVAENESDDENMLDGYTLYEDGITVPAKTAGTLNFYIANYGYLSPIRKITLSFETGVEEIENAANGVVRIFDLNGREIKGTPEKGVYIRIQNGKATKVVI